jgi:hypothetical protein
MGVRVVKEITSATEDFVLEYEVKFIVSDNASNMKKVLDVMNAMETSFS